MTTNDKPTKTTIANGLLTLTFLSLAVAVVLIAAIRLSYDFGHDLGWWGKPAPAPCVNVTVNRPGAAS